MAAILGMWSVDRVVLPGPGGGHAARVRLDPYWPGTRPVVAVLAIARPSGWGAPFAAFGSILLGLICFEVWAVRHRHDDVCPCALFNALICGRPISPCPLAGRQAKLAFAFDDRRSRAGGAGSRS